MFDDDDDFEIELPDGFRGVQMHVKGAKSKKAKAKAPKKVKESPKAFRNRLSSQSFIRR